VNSLRSRDNPRVRHWHALAHDGRARRQSGRALLEGTHLLGALLGSGGRPVSLLVSETGRDNSEIAALVRRAGAEPALLTDSLFRWVVDVATPAGIAAEIEIPGPVPDAAEGDCVFLEAIQDAGNVGAILRSAAAFGVRTGVLDGHCADPWSPKVLRAAMGAHFSLSIQRSGDLAAAVVAFGGTTVCAAAHGGRALVEIDLGERVGWILGAEGQGVSAALRSLAAQSATIGLAPRTESLNVAAAAAIFFYERARRAAAATTPPRAPSTRGARS
jgi:RNA methyltransferase, TrmH family